MWYLRNFYATVVFHSPRDKDLPPIVQNPPTAITDSHHNCGSHIIENGMGVSQEEGGGGSGEGRGRGSGE